MKFKTQYSEHKASSYTFDQSGEESMTRQSEHEETDINVIMERFNRSGKLPSMQSQHPRYGEAIAMPYDQALIVVKQAQEAFLSLPANVRKEFSNDPAEMEYFLKDPKNHDKAIELGLLEVREPSSDQLLTEIVKNTKKPADNA